MKLISLHIENFGKLCDHSITFDDGCNSFCEENGFGKTTITSFIRVMLFGFDGERARNGEPNERKRFEPWIRKGIYGGELVFSTNGKTYTLKRSFGKKEKEDIYELRDKKTGLPSEDFKEIPGEGIKIGEQILQIDRASFMRTVFVSQNDCATEGTDKIAAKIGRIAEDTADISSFEEAVSALHDLSNKLSFTRKTGEGYKLNEEMSRLSLELSQKEHLLSERNSLSERIRRFCSEEQTMTSGEKELDKEQELVNLANDAKGRLGRYEEIKTQEEAEKRRLSETSASFKGRIPSLESLNHLRNICFEYEHLRARLAEDETISPEAAKCEMDAVTEQIAFHRSEARERASRNRRLKVVMLVAGIMLLLLGVGALALSRLGVLRIENMGMLTWLSGTGFALGIGFTVFSFVYKENAGVGEADIFAMQAELEQLSDKLDAYKRDRALLGNAEYELQKGFESIGEQVPENPVEYVMDLVDKVREIETLKKRLEEVRTNRLNLENRLNVAELREILQQAEGLRSNSELAIEKETLKNEKARLSSLYRSDVKKLEELEEKLAELDEVENALLNASEKKEEYAGKLKSAELASEYLELARKEFAAEYTSPMTDSFKKWYALLSENAPTKFLIDAKAGLSIEEAGLNRNTSSFSAGYKDLFGLSLRMALIDCMYKEEKPFIIMDDPFVNLDDRRLTGAKAFLREVSKEYQVIYMTCRKECVI